MTSYPPLINSHTKEETQRLNFFFAMQKACTPLPVRDKTSLLSVMSTCLFGRVKKKIIQIKPVSKNLHFPTLA